jgi:glycosyltransferase involved in cell wall biosynthesis
MPSLLEGLPLALLEAISYQLPVVVSDIPPHIEIVGSSGPGHRVFSASDEVHMAKAIRQTLDDDLAFVSSACSELEQRVAEEYSWDRITSITEDVYLEAIDGGRLAGPGNSG